VSGGASSIEGLEVAANGLTVDVVDAATWSTMTASQFASYRAIILGDPTCVGPGTSSDIDAAAANAKVWGRVVNGNVVIVGSDPVYHAGQGGETVTQRAVDFAVNQVGKTGAYISLSCYYHDTGSSTPVPVLDGIGAGGFTVTGVGCYDDAHIVAQSSALAGLADADLSNWSCSVHEAFQTWSPGLIPLAIARDFDSSFTASDGTQGPPYILAGGNIRSFPLSLSPLNATARPGGKHTVTARLLDGSTSQPIAGALMRFSVIAGPNAGVAGKCNPTSCRTNTAGRVSWTYRSNGRVGRDLVQTFHDPNGNGVPDPGEPLTTAGMQWAVFRYVALGDSYSSGEGVDPYLRDGYDKNGKQTGSVDNRCHRSTRAYAEYVKPHGYTKSLYAIASGDGEPGTGKRVNKYGSDKNVRQANKVAWGFFACSGAITSNVLSAADGGYGQTTSKGFIDGKPQLDNGFINSATSLVTITIGGNDVGFGKVVRFCYFSKNCTTEPFEGKKLAQYARDQRDALSGQLDMVYADIYAKAPNARLLVLGYPQLFPKTDAEQNCGKLAQHSAVGKSIGFSHTEQNFLRRAASELNQTIAARVELSGVATFVPVDRKFAGHEVCGSKGEWINGVSLSDNGSFNGNASFHPNTSGQRFGYAASVNAALSGG
jgi:hypothetical protein